MKTVQLRRYEIEAASLDAFASWMTDHLIPVREAAGFEVEFMVVDHERSEIVWAVSVAGDEARFREIDTAYASSDARAEAFTHVPVMASAQQLGFVTRVR